MLVTRVYILAKKAISTDYYNIGVFTSKVVGVGQFTFF